MKMGNLSAAARRNQSRQDGENDSSKDKEDVECAMCH